MLVSKDTKRSNRAGELHYPYPAPAKDYLQKLINATFQVQDPTEKHLNNLLLPGLSKAAIPPLFPKGEG